AIQQDLILSTSLRKEAPAGEALWFPCGLPLHITTEEEPLGSGQGTKSAAGGVLLSRTSWPRAHRDLLTSAGTAQKQAFRVWGPSCRGEGMKDG
ncbi:mCG144861, partial [Mus musculus]